MTILRNIIILAFLSLSIHASGSILDELPTESQVLDGFSTIDSVKTRISQSPRHEIEGIWQFLDNGSIVAIERYDPNNILENTQYFYRIVIIKSNQLHIEPGTIMGYAIATTKPNCYDAHIYTSSLLDGILSSPHTFTLNLKDDFLSFNRYKTEIKVNLWRWLPYIYRIGLSVNNTRPNGLDGCLRIYPQSAKKPHAPRYL